MNHSYPTSLVWLRRDLRLQDNSALEQAARASQNVAIVFVFDTQILNQLKTKNDRRVSFIFDSLRELDEELRIEGSQLIVRYGNPASEIPKLAKKIQAKALFYNEDYEPYAKTRDHQVTKELGKAGVDVFEHKDQVIFSGDEVIKANNSPYQVFTPYKKVWLKKLTAADYKSKIMPINFINKKSILKFSEKLSIERFGFEYVGPEYGFQSAGRNAAKKQLARFSKYIEDYEQNRNYPNLGNGTSSLSVHLRFGTISVRECVKLCRKSKSKGAQTWLSELIWREFYLMILDQYPYVAKGCFKKQYDAIEWINNQKHLNAWKNGKTGFPIVDAGMRQLNRTGWMHNRVRMITASFLVKDLLIDWRKGESYFAEKLLDFDMASNNGGWQWSASTGCDAQPYFRIFNPSLQSQRFDSDAAYIKKWLPELENCSPKDIHNPEDSELNLKAEYPKPIICHATQKKRALLMFKKVKS